MVKTGSFVVVVFVFFRGGQILYYPGKKIDHFYTLSIIFVFSASSHVFPFIYFYNAYINIYG